MFSLIRLFTFLAVIVDSCCTYTYPKGLPCKVYNKTILDCSNRKLTSIPPLKDHNVKTLDLSYNNLETVNGTSFIHLTSLQELDLSHNSVSNITFDASLSLRVLDLSYNKILYISNDTLPGLNTLEILHLSHQNSLILHGSPFYSTTSLKKLYITDSGLSSLPPSVFSGLHELQWLDMESNSIDFLPDSVFQGLTNLIFLNVNNNYMDFNSPPATMFEDLTSLKYLKLDSNHISRLPETLFVNLTSLTYLSLTGISASGIRRLSSLPEKLFAKLVNLENLLLSRNDISNLPETVFVNLTRLMFLDLHNNALTSTSCKAIEGLSMLPDLNIADNHFDYLTCPFGNMSSLNSLLLSHSTDYRPQYTEYWNETKWSELITRLPASLKTLYLGVNKKCVFQSVRAGSLLHSSVTKLIILRLYSDYDAELSVKDDAFSMFPYLKQLIFTVIFTSAGGRWSTYLSRYAFRGLSHLELLDLSYNNLAIFPSNALQVLAGSLKHLDLSNNDLTSTHDNQKITFQLESMDISNNPITYITPLSNQIYATDLDIFFRIMICPTEAMTLRSIHISTKTNDVYSQTDPGCMPLCTVSSKLEEISFNKLSFNNKYPFVWGNCSHLTSLSISESNNVFVYTQGIFPRLEQLTLTNCKLSSIAQFLLESRNIRYLDVSNNNIDNIKRNNFSSLVNLHHMDLSHNRIESLPENHFHHMSNLTYLNLAGNNLANLNLKGMNSLQTLIVSGNSLTTLPSFLMKEPYTLLDFGDNSFSCTCDIEPLQDLILTDEITYIDPQFAYLCKSPAKRENRGITSFSLDCSLHLEYYIPPSVSGLIVICVISALVYKYRWRIHYKYWVLCYQRRYQRYVDNDDDADIMNSDDEDDVDADHRYEAPIMRRQYHAYVAYHRESQAWIDDQLTPNIEDGPEPFRLCMKERGDIPAGHYILNAICHGISKSRKTIVVLSENFMDDGWCHYQLQIARMRLVMDNEDVLILVQIGEIPDHKKTFLLRQILQNKEVLKWTEDPIGQELFWNQLKMKLRKPARVNRRFEEV
ncbi:uncharacterized protein [Amphiura filiformis]|uniref:uncharacterized protein n=1 Tax=Amphiura filiformis TaxID=82378 RepID=UPI003B226E73